jgi:hypothetical protein
MGTKQKQHAVIEFLLVERRPGDKIAIRLRNVDEEAAHSRATVFRGIGKIHSGNSELQSDTSRGRPSGYKTDGNIQNILRKPIRVISQDRREAGDFS